MKTYLQLQGVQSNHLDSLGFVKKTCCFREFWYSLRVNACCQASHEIQCFLFAFAQLELQYKGNSIEDAYHIFVVVLGFHYDNRV